MAKNSGKRERLAELQPCTSTMAQSTTRRNKDRRIDQDCRKLTQVGLSGPATLYCMPQKNTEGKLGTHIHTSETNNNGQRSNWSFSFHGPLLRGILLGSFPLDVYDKTKRKEMGLPDRYALLMTEWIWVIWSMSSGLARRTMTEALGAGRVESVMMQRWR